MPFRLAILPIRHPSITRRLLQTSTLAQAADSTKKTRRKREVFAEPYHTDLDFGLFSCDWDKWNHCWFLDINDEWHDLSEMEFHVKRLAKIPGTIRPLAYVHGPDPCIAFEAAGKYFYLNTAADFLERFGRFRSHDDFLRALSAVPRLKGALHEFPNDTSELYAAVGKEQARRAEKAFSEADKALYLV
ncbi:hypothetical protein C8F01DRAFT_638208 [Mycena amicta]|nr:hypothetical protein C8F01DRAFT_638208 [Mycena amicta]